LLELKPQSIYSYLASITNKNNKFIVEKKLYSQYRINRYLSLHKKGIALIQDLNKTFYKLTDLEHYNLLFDFYPKVGFIQTKGALISNKEFIDAKIYNKLQRSATDIKRVLHG